MQLVNRLNGHGTVETLRTGAGGRCTDTADVATGTTAISGSLERISPSKPPNPIPQEKP